MSADKRGLHNKYVCARTDAQDEPGGKHDGCDLFVFDLTHDPLAVVAVRTYATLVAKERPTLSADLLERYPEPPHADSDCWCTP